MKCFLCSTNSVSTFLKAKKRILLRCSRCHLIYISPNTKSSHEIINNEYEARFLKEYLEEERFYKKYFIEKLDLLETYKRPGKILDIGCGAGLFLFLANKRKWKSIGVDTSQSAIRYLLSRRIKAKYGKFEDIPFEESSFDAISIFQTIEHIPNPLVILKKANKTLKSKGVLFITTPDERGFMARLMGKRWFGYRNEEHVFFYNELSLRKMLEKSGFRNITIKKESSRMMTVSWVLTRIFGYYYNHHTLIVQIMLKTRHVWRLFDWVKFREPEVNLVAIAVKK